MERLAPSTTTRPHHTSGATGGREDCWSEGATEVLIEAWGERYVRLNRGNLRQNDWKEVADAVNSRQNGVKPRKTDVQCKNRVDTLKKKYKLEKSKPPPSKWLFYNRVESLVGTSSVTPKKSSAVIFNVKNSKPKLISNHNQVIYSAGSSRLNSSGGGSTESSLGLDNEEGDGEGDDNDLGCDRRVPGKRQMETVDFSDGAAFKELARAILKFGEIYERIETSKQQHVMELEKQRMEFTKDLEFQRINMFMDAQKELEKIKRKKYASASALAGKKL